MCVFLKRPKKSAFVLMQGWVINLSPEKVLQKFPLALLSSYTHWCCSKIVQLDCCTSVKSCTSLKMCTSIESCTSVESCTCVKRGLKYQSMHNIPRYNTQHINSGPLQVPWITFNMGNYSGDPYCKILTVKVHHICNALCFLALQSSADGCSQTQMVQHSYKESAQQVTITGPFE